MKSLTTKQLKLKAQQMMRDKLPGADLAFQWVQTPKTVTYPTGVRGMIGKVLVTAPGYRPRIMIVDHDDTGTMVRA